MKSLKGLCIFPGLAMAKVLRGAVEIETSKRAFLGVEEEKALFKSALVLTERQIEDIKVAASKRLRKEEADIFEAHRMMLTDPEYIESIEGDIQSKKIPAAQAIHDVTETFIKLLSVSSSDYLRERVADLRDISGRLIRNLDPQDDGLTADGEFIYVGIDLAPSDLMALSEKQMKGAVLAKGGTTSHTSILLKSMGIPSIIGVTDVEAWLKDTKSQGEMALLNATQGTFELNPPSDRMNSFREQLAREEKQKAEMQIWKTKASVLEDSQKLPLLANVGSQKQLEQGLEEGSEGVGLYRTEFLFLDRAKAPDLKEQTEIYLQAVRSLKGKTLVVRTLDIGGDKQVSYMDLPKEENPFLGVRGLRLCLEREPLFKTQLQALIAASEEGPIDVMFPMVTDPKELEQTFAIIKPLLTPKANIRWGMMLEVPANLFMIPELSKHVDFFSVGTNDLTQYMTASDRMNPDVQHLNDLYSPGVLRAIAHLARETKAAGREWSICGEMAADQLLLPFVVGLGVSKLSMSARMIARQRAFLSVLDRKACEELAQKVLRASNREEVIECLKPMAEKSPLI